MTGSQNSKKQTILGRLPVAKIDFRSILAFITLLLLVALAYAVTP